VQWHVLAGAVWLHTAACLLLQVPRRTALLGTVA
jgi:hypothetical protein